jgi:hypothetical protein
MSKISLEGNVSGSGTLTIAAPNTNSNFTLTLPTETGTIITNSGNQAGSFTTLNTSGAVVFNDAGADVDFRVEGDTDANLLFVDASADVVGIGTGSPSTSKVTIERNGGQLRVRNTTTRYRSDYGVNSTGTTEINSFDDTGSVYMPLVFDGNPLQFFISASEKMRIDSAGNVGIGTSSPTASKLVVSEAAGSGTLRTILTLRTAESTAGTGGSLDFTQDTTVVGRVSSIYEGAGQIGMAFSTFNAALNERMRISAGGTITFNAYGAGTLSTSASGVISASDGRYKTKTRQIDTALSVIQSLQPTYFRWHEDSPFASEYEELGFVAQEVAEVIPEASPGEDEEEKYRNYHDRAIIAMLVKGVQELKAELDSAKEANAALEARITAIENGA